ncbi:MAG: hypothetical protein JNK87_24300 [Bryobacterales bacterium]|nr:hypothetical protein [Bryobacterales bacterium]
MLAILMLPAIPFRRSAGFKAEAQTLGSCEPVGGNRIIRKYCGAGGSPVFQLDKFESDAITTYLALHGLPETDANVIHAYGRRDVRNAVRAIMVSRLASIVKKAPSQRTADEQAIYNWFEGIVQRNEIEFFTQSLAHFTSFVNDPCRFRTDAGIAKVLGINYDGGPFCTLLGRIYPPPVPSSDYFRMYGMSKSYGKFADSFSNATAVAADTQLNMQMVAGISGAVVALVTGAVYAGFTAVAYAAAVAAVTVVTTTKIAGDLWAISTVVGTVSGYGFLLPALGPAAIVIVAATMIATVGIQTFDNQRQLDNLANLRTGLERAQTTKPDLKAMLDDASGLGFNKFSLSLVGETLPEVESTTVLPQRRPSIDPVFRVADTRGNSMIFNELTYRDWNETIWSASTWGGWFVQRCLNDKGVSTCALRDSITASIRYLDWNRAKWTASRLGNRFTHTKLGPVAAGDAPCPPDPTTGVSPGPDFSKCSTYVSDSINLLDGNGNGLQSTVTLVPYEAPRFTGPTVLSFSPGLAASHQIVAEGSGGQPNPYDLCHRSDHAGPDLGPVLRALAVYHFLQRYRVASHRPFPDQADGSQCRPYGHPGLHHKCGYGCEDHHARHIEYVLQAAGELHHCRGWFAQAPVHPGPGSESGGTLVPR